MNKQVPQPNQIIQARVSKITEKRIFCQTTNKLTAEIADYEFKDFIIPSTIKIGQILNLVVKHFQNDVISAYVLNKNNDIEQSSIFEGQILTGIVVKHLEFGIVISLMNVSPVTTLLIPQSQCNNGIGLKSAQSMLKQLIPMFSHVNCIVTEIQEGNNGNKKFRGSLLKKAFEKFGQNYENFTIVQKYNKFKNDESATNKFIERKDNIQQEEQYPAEPDVILASRKQQSTYSSDISCIFEFFDKQKQPQSISFDIEKRSEVQIMQFAKHIDHQQQGQSPKQFEMLISQQPKSSYLYLQYASYYLDRANLDAALSILQRGKDAIGQSNETDLLERNNLECAHLHIILQFYGNEKFIIELKKSFSQCAMPGKLCIQLVENMDESKSSFKQQIFDIFFNSKINRKDFDVQKCRLQFLYSEKEYQQARQLIPMVIQQVDLASGQSTRQFMSFIAHLEYQSGNIAEGRAAFENIINQSKIDIILQYIEAEEKYAKDNDYFRNLMKKLVDRDYGSKKNKILAILLKKWLIFEQKQGDQQRIQEIKQMAIQLLE